MNLTKITLPVINNNPAGVVNCYLFHDDSITDLVYPSKVTFLSIGALRESIDSTAGVTEFDNVDIEVKEDYSYYTTEGFWHKIINDYIDYDFELMFTITEGTDETFSFKGKIYRKNIVETEHYLDDYDSPTSVVRGIKFKIVTSLTVLQNVTVTDLITECKLHLTAGTAEANWSYIKFSEIIACMIKLACDDPAGSHTIDSDLVVCNAYDIIMGTDDARVWTDYYICVKQSTTYIGYFDPSASYGWISRYKNAYDLLLALCRQFGSVPKLLYGESTGILGTNYHRIILNSRGKQGETPTLTMDGKVLKSEFIANTSYTGRNIRATESIGNINGSASDPASFWYFDNIYGTGEPPKFADFDLDLPCDFAAVNYSDSRTGYNYMMAIYFDLTETYPDSRVTTVSYFDYSASPPAYVECATAGSALNFYNNFLRALVEYFYHRFLNSRTQYNRTYGSLKSTTGGTSSQRNCQTTMRTTISDGVTARNFYATEVEKDIFSNKTKVVWVEE